MPDRTGFKKVDYAQWYGAYSTVERLANALHIAHQQDVRERANQRDGGDINQCRCETVTLRQYPTTSGTVMPPRPPAKLNTPPVKPIRRIGAREETSDRNRSKTVAEECQRHQAHNHHRIVGVVSAHNAGGDQQAADNRRFTRKAQ